MTSYGVVGLGAVGGLYGSRIQLAGREVHYLVRRHAEIIRRDGLHVASPWGALDDPTPAVFDDPAAMPRCDVVLVALKTTANAALDTILPAITHPGSLVVMLQNGLGVEADAARSVPPERVLGGLCFVCAHLRAPGRVEHLDYGQMLLGAQRGDGRPAGITPELERVAADFRAGGVPVDLAPDVAGARWAKLCWNIAYNGPSVVHHADTRMLMDDHIYRSEVEALMAEVAATAAACGSPLPAGHVQEMLDRTQRMVAYLPSMRLDFDAGRPLEVDAIYSRPIAAATAHGVSVATMTRIRDRLLALSADVGAGAGS